ncbi:EF-hand domain-containing family member B [Drosophila elegans]|uniref:EF-hand domain-containing family member B n=1 Tax=Drosophila elegans TaxID=30023 RepID=UPI0007E89430|nr:EF-hand domain-containing family member B [Drosophila elegans]
MANKGHFVDRNADIPTAGLSTIGLDGEGDVRECLIINNTEELAENVVRAKCQLERNTWNSLPAGSVIPTSSLGELLTSELQKSRFVSFKEKFYEEMYHKKANLAQAKPTFSKPDSVTNLSQTFGRPSNLTPSESLYSIILPPKSPEQVNREYQEFHDKYIISHNRYFPSEQINRKYSQSFDRNSPCGDFHSLGDFGLKVKRCLEEGGNHLKVIGKSQMDFMNRTEAPLGKKLNRYSCAVPDITFGQPLRSNGDVKMLLHNIVPCDKSNQLLDAISYLNRKRHSLRKSLDFHGLISMLERSDNNKSGYLPLSRIVEIIGNLHIRLDSQLIRVALSHFHMIIDEGCATERVNYSDFCRLLSIQEPLPKTGNLNPISDASCLDTTYRLLCSDRHKRANEDPVIGSQHFEEDRTRVKDLVAPDLAILCGLKPSDFTRLRPKSEIERIFRRLVPTEKFEDIWQTLMAGHKDQNNTASVRQFHIEMHHKNAT